MRSTWLGYYYCSIELHIWPCDLMAVGLPMWRPFPCRINQIVLENLSFGWKLFNGIHQKCCSCHYVHNFLIIKTLASGSLITRPCVCVFVSARAREPWGEWENCESHYISDMHRLRQQSVCVPLPHPQTLVSSPQLEIKEKHTEHSPSSNCTCYTHIGMYLYFSWCGLHCRLNNYSNARHKLIRRKWHMRNMSVENRW